MFSVCFSVHGWVEYPSPVLVLSGGRTYLLILYKGELSTPNPVGGGVAQTGPEVHQTGPGDTPEQDQDRTKGVPLLSGQD